jgi:Family of unknown function (DUF6508)
VRHDGRAVDIPDRLRALANLVPILESGDVDFGHWEVTPPTGGVHHLPYYKFGPVADAFTAAVGRGGWVIIGFDWRTWLEADEGRAFRDRPEAVAAATPDQLAKLLTAIVRSDRFVEGSIAGAFESGLLARIARRATALLAEVEPGRD